MEAPPLLPTQGGSGDVGRPILQVLLKGRMIMSLLARSCKAKSRDFESRPHKAFTFEVEGDTEILGVRELKMPEALPGLSGGKMPGRSNAEGGRVEKEEENEVWQVEKVVMSAVLAADPVNSATSCDLAETVEETCDVEKSSIGGLAEEPFQHVGPSWDCSQVENELEERCDGLACRC